MIWRDAGHPYTVNFNEYYLKGHMVVDPICDTRFPQYAAAATLKWNGKTDYFVGEETQREFAEKERDCVVTMTCGMVPAMALA